MHHRRAILGLVSLVLAVYLHVAVYFGQLPWMFARQARKTIMATKGSYVQGIPSHERRKAAVLGALVADAATMPLHWYAPPTRFVDRRADGD